MRKVGASFPVVVAAALVLACPTEAHAYLDPGTGSVVFQAAIAATVAALFTLKTYWQFLKAWFTGKKAAAEEKSSDGK